jgi:hypothetical protein
MLRRIQFRGIIGEYGIRRGLTAEGMMISIADAIDADALRIRHEFLDMPGLVLTVAQTAKLYALSTSHARALLDSLIEEGFLVGDAGGSYRRSMSPIRG